MKVTVRDNKILKTIYPQILAEYLQTNGWHNEGLFYGKAWIWHKNSDQGELFEIHQPISQNFDEKEARLMSAVCQAIDLVFEALGTEVSDEEYIKSSEWTGVVEAALRALQAMEIQSQTAVKV
jgi:hypothetical protein